MSVASHLHIKLEEYDSRIRTFIPGYEDMLAAAAQSLAALDVPGSARRRSRHRDGCAADACLRVQPEAR